MGRVLALLILALLAASAGCDDSSSGDSYDDDLSTVLAALHATPTPAPGSFGSLAYDQRHTVCSEAAELFEEEANAHASAGYTWPSAKPSFYTKCMDCGGPTKVYAYVSADVKLYTGCVGLSGPVIPDGATGFWP